MEPPAEELVDVRPLDPEDPELPLERPPPEELLPELLLPPPRPPPPFLLSRLWSGATTSAARGAASRSSIRLIALISGIDAALDTDVASATPATRFESFIVDRCEVGVRVWSRCAETILMCARFVSGTGETVKGVLLFQECVDITVVSRYNSAFVWLIVTKQKADKGQGWAYMYVWKQ